MRSQKELSTSGDLCLGPLPIAGACNLAAALLSLAEHAQPHLSAPAGRDTERLLCPFKAFVLVTPVWFTLTLFQDVVFSVSFLFFFIRYPKKVFGVESSMSMSLSGDLKKMIFTLNCIVQSIKQVLCETVL